MSKDGRQVMIDGIPQEDNLTISKEGWREYGVHVLAELKRLNSCYGSLLDEMIIVKQEIAMLKIKAGLWGAAAGAIPSLAALLIYVVAK